MKRNSLFILFFTAVLFSCEKAVDIKLDDVSPKIVVEATIENNTVPVVALSKSLGYFSAINPSILAGSFVHNAEVYVSNGTLTHKLKEYAVPAGNGYLDIKPGVVFILYYEKKEFMYLNMFRFVNKDDFLYYVLLIAEEFGIDRTTAMLTLSGEIIPDAQLYDELWKFFSHINFLPANEHIQLPEALQQKPMHMFNTLLSLDVCE